MAKNHIQEGRVMNWTNSTGADVLSGAVVLVGVMVCVALGNIADGEEGRLATEEVFELPKAAGLAIDQGDRLYWDDADGELNKTELDNFDAGVAFTSAADTDTTVQIKLGA